MNLINKLIILLILVLCNSFVNGQERKEILVFVSFSMNDSALQSYFKEGQRLGARLVMRGLINNSFQDTQRKMQELKINIEIDPTKFEEYGIKRVPAIVVVSSRDIRKITGHLPLSNALEIMEKDKK